MQLPYQNFPKLGGRFVSEFGMHGFPDIRTGKVFAPEQKSLYPNSKVMDCHNKSRGAENKMGRYLWENFRMPTSMEGFVYLSQLLQAEALDHAIIHWRGEWKGVGHELNAGSIIWQLQDSNSTTSWSLVDYYFRPKPAFFTTTRAFAPLSVGIARTPVWHFVDENDRHDTDIPTFEVWGSNLKVEERKVELRLRMYDIAYKKEIDLGAQGKGQFTLKANSSTELGVFKSPEAVVEDSYVILSATIHDPTTGVELCRKVSWPEPYRYLDLPEDSDVEVIAEGDQVRLVCQKYPVKGLVAYVFPEDGEDAEWEDNMWDLMPGEEVQVCARGLNGRKVHARHLAVNK
jgi:beta-mannosidase